MPREPVSGVDYNTHSDVQTCLNDIMNAVKGDEVRGSIHDAIALIDDRSVNLEQEIRSQAEEITNDALNVHYPLFEIDSDTWEGTCSISGSKMLHLIQYKEAIEPILKVGNNAILHSSTTTANIGTNGPIVKCYYVAPNASNLICYEMHMEYGASKNVTCTRTLTPISGGGSSYTEGDGIDINNDEISVKLRSSNPGLAFTNDGELYATGGGGGSYSEGYGIDITNDTISADAVRCKLRIDQQGNVTSSISGDILYALINETASIYEGHTVVFDVSIANRGSFSNLQAEHNTTQEGGIRLHFHEVTNTNSGYVIYEFTVVLPSSGYTGTCTHSTINIQPKLTAGTGISIDPTTNTISLDLPQAEGGGF